MSERGGSKADTLVKLVLVFFISLLSFSVGTFVGKQVSDSDHRRMALEGEYGRKVASEDSHEESSDKITEKEIESLTEEFVNKEKTMPAEEPAKPATVEKEAIADKSGYKSVNRKTASVDATHKVADKVAKDEAPTDGMKEPRKPAAALPAMAATSVGKYTVQVASYADETEAKKHAGDLKEKGWHAFYLAANVSGKTWYRVVVGLFNNQEKAKEFRAQFMKESNAKAAIVQKIVQ